MIILSSFGLVVVASLTWTISGFITNHFSGRILSGIAVLTLIGCFLAAIGALYAIVIWAGLICIAAALRQSRFRGYRKTASAQWDADFWAYALLLSVVTFIVWPSLVRPPTDGDTMIYHLPNASSWLYSHSIWQTATHYWWYPPGSEMATAVVVAASGIFALPIVGAAAFLALASGIYEASRLAGASVHFSTACALALVTSHCAAIQAGDMQNDVLVAALVVSGLWSKEAANAWTLALLALTKPSGVALAISRAMLAHRRRRFAVGVVLASISLLWIRNAILRENALNPIPLLPDGAVLQSSILAHGREGLLTLARSSVADGYTTAVFVVLAFGAILLPVPWKQRILALAVCAIWIASPFSFESGGIAQLAIGSALRFGLPAMAIGALSLSAMAARICTAAVPIEYLATAVLGLLVAGNLAQFRAIYANDGNTSLEPVVPVVVIVVSILVWALKERPMVIRGGLIGLATFSMLLVALDRRQHAHVIQYYSDALGEQNSDSALPRQFMTSTGRILITDGYATGIADMLRPDALIVNPPFDSNPCLISVKLNAIAYIPASENTLVPSRSDMKCSIHRTSNRDTIIVPETP